MFGPTGLEIVQHLNALIKTLMILVLRGWNVVGNLNVLIKILMFLVSQAWKLFIFKCFDKTIDVVGPAGLKIV